MNTTRLLLFFTLLFATLTASAQDIIVKKDGGTIAAKVMEITSTAVKYKKYSLQQGPTYVIAVADVSYINYENGQREDFATSSSTAATNPLILQSNETTSDQDLLKNYFGDNYKKAKKLKKAAWIGGGAFVGMGTLSLIVALTVAKDDGYGYHEGYYFPLLASSGAAYLVGVVWWTSFYVAAKRKEKNSDFVVSAPLMQFKLCEGKRSNLYTSVDLLNDKLSRNRTLGLGLHLNF